MPLTSTSLVQRTFPSIFAENVTQHVKNRRENYRIGKTRLKIQNKEVECLDMATILEDSNEVEQPVSTSPQQLITHSRLSPEINKLSTLPLTERTNSRSGTDSNNSSTSVTPSHTPSTSPRDKCSPSPRPVNFLESPRPRSGTSVPAFTVLTPRKARTSPRMTCSLDNVDLWEDESDSDSTDTAPFKQFLDPSKTIDFSDIHRSQSPVACKRNKTETKDSTVLESKEALKDIRSHVKSRLRLNRRLRSLSAKATTTEKRKTQTEPDPDTSNPTTTKGKLLSHRTRIAAKFSNMESDNITPQDRDNIVPETVSLTQEKDMSLTKLSDSKTVAKQILPSKSTKEDNVKIDSTNVLANFPNISEKPKSEQLYKSLKIQKEKGILHDSPSNSPGEHRRVKFNNFVSVRNDEANTLEFLKRTNDTAKAFKTRYLNLNDSGSILYA